MKNNKTLLVQAILVTSLFLAIIGVYVFQADQLDEYQQQSLERFTEVENKLNKLELLMTNHYATVVVKIENIEADIIEIKDMIKELERGR